jgi:hypothetical protein
MHNFLQTNDVLVYIIIITGMVEWVAELKDFFSPSPQLLHNFFYESRPFFITSSQF